jgi:TonB family protein
MKPLMLFFMVCSLTACSSTQQLSEDLTLPELLMQQPLPAFPVPLLSSTLRIELEIQVDIDGSVRAANIVSTSGNSDWDSAALIAVKQWRYSPALYQEKPIRLWLHQTAIVQFTQPTMIALAEIQCATAEAADSAFAMLKDGVPFAQVVSLFSISNSRKQNGQIGEVNIRLYPTSIKQQIERLGEDEYTHPIKFGDRYVIFKRVQSSQQALL